MVICPAESWWRSPDSVSCASGLDEAEDNEAEEDAAGKIDMRAHIRITEERIAILRKEYSVRA
jgi:hypothetical protein